MYREAVGQTDFSRTLVAGRGDVRGTKTEKWQFWRNLERDEPTEGSKSFKHIRNPGLLDRKNI